MDIAVQGSLRSYGRVLRYYTIKTRDAQYIKTHPFLGVFLCSKFTELNRTARRGVVPLF